MAAPGLEAQLRARDELENRRCQERLWYFLSKHVRTKDEHAPAHKSVRPFPQYGYMETISDLVTEMTRDEVGMERHKYHTVLIGKSRQIMMSWWATGVCLHRARFNPNRLVIMQSKRADDARAGGKIDVTGKGVGLGLLGRAQFIEQHLTPGLRVPLPKSKENISYPNGSVIWAIPHGSDVIRSHTPSLYWPDEFAFHGNETGEEWAAAQPALEGGIGQAIVVTTPNGHEFFYTLAPWDHWRDWPTWGDGVHYHELSPGRIALFIHATADPNKRSVEFWDRIEARYKQEKGTAGLRRFRREMEGDFGIHSGEPVWPEFDRNIHLISDKDPYINPDAPIYRAWDFGFNGQAVVFAQMSADGQISILRSEIKQKVGLAPFAQKQQAYWPNATYVDVGDPSGMSHNAQGETIQQTMANLGMTLYAKTTSGRKIDLIDQVRNLFPPRTDGTPGVMIYEKTNTALIQALEGGYHYPEAKEGEAEKEVPHKDGYYDHLCDALEYLIDNMKPSRSVGGTRGFKTKFTYKSHVIKGTNYRGYTRQG